MGRKKLVPALVILALILCFAFALSRAQRHTGLRQRLPDGSYLRLGAVQFSKGHPYNAPVNQIAGWRAQIAKVLPTSIRMQLDWMPFGGGSLTLPSWQTNLAVFTLFEGSTNSRYAVLRLVVSDETGSNSFDAGATQGAAVTSDGMYQYQVNGWVVSKFTPRGRKLRLRYYDWFKTNACVAEFLVPNPAMENSVTR